MTRNVVVLGAGTGGTLLANRLRRRLAADEVAITVIDQDDRHLYQPGLLLVPFGLMSPRRLVRSRRSLLAPGIDFRLATVDQVDMEAKTVALHGGDRVPYDVLIVASGATLAPDETEGLTGEGWMRDVFTFYSLEGSAALAGRLATMESGRLVVNVVDMPVKCPVAPLEFCFLADWYLRRHGVRDRVDITYVTPLDAAFTKPVAAATLGQLLERKRIRLVTEFNTGQVDGSAGKLVGYDGTEVDFDLAVVIPAHSGAAYVTNSAGLGDDLGFVPTDWYTLQSKASPDVFVIGDATDLPASKAGSVAHFEGEVLARNIELHLAGEPLDPGFDGHANCFIETGYGMALLADFNYDVEPVEGRFPGPLGLPLLRESRFNHVAKRLFEPFYWNVLLRGLDVPGISARMPMRGKYVDLRRYLAAGASPPDPSAATSEERDDA